MSRQHLKGYNAPLSWPVKRKETAYVAKPSPGPHNTEDCITVGVLIRGYLKYAKTAREIRKILHADKILVNKKAVHDYKFPLGLFDTIEISDTKEAYRVMINERGRTTLEKIEMTNTAFQLCRVNGKTLLKGKKMQLNLGSGRNVLVDKDSYNVGDSVVYNLTDKKIMKHLKLEKGAKVFLTKGKYAGTHGVIESIRNFEGMRRPEITVTTKEGNLETLKEYTVVIDDSIRGSK